MNISQNPEYSLAGYYDFYGRPAVVWVGAFGDLLASIYVPELRTFLAHRDPKKVSMDGLRIDRPSMAGLIRATTKALSQNKICDICGQNETWGVHTECGDAVLVRLEESPDPDGVTGRFRNVITDAIRLQLEKEAEGPSPEGLRLVTLLYYWSVTFPQVDEWCPTKWDILRWAMKGRVLETVRYLKIVGTPRAGKVLAALATHREYRFKKPTSFADAWRLGSIQQSLAWLKEEWRQGL